MTFSAVLSSGDGDCWYHPFSLVVFLGEMETVGVSIVISCPKTFCHVLSILN